MKTVVEMAREAGLLIDNNDRLSTSRTTSFHVENCYFDIERFAALVRADEREACEKACESIESDGYPTIEHQQCAAAIRARGETKCKS